MATQSKATVIKPPQGKLAVRTLILGIFGLLWSCVPVFGFIGLLSGTAAIILGFVGIKTNNKGSYIVIGMITGALAVIAFIVASIFYLFFVSQSINSSLQN